MIMMTEEEKGYDDRCQEHVEIYAKILENYANFSQRMYPDDPSVWKTLDYVGYIKIFACTIIVIGGILGNISVLLTVVLRKSMRTTINIYIANLAVADVMTCIICTGSFALQEATKVYVLGKSMCKVEMSAKILCLTSSVLFLAVISFDRFVAVMFPLYVRVTKKRPWLLIMIVWIASSAIAIPPIIVARHFSIEWKNFMETDCFENWPTEWHYDELLKDCIAHRPLAAAYIVVLNVAVFFLPLLVMVIAYSFILWKVWTTEVPGEQQAANVNINSRTRKKVNKMIFVVIVVFIICWTPYQVSMLYSHLGLKMTLDLNVPDWFRGFSWFAVYMALANSFVNPIIYGIYNKNFREGLWTIFPCAYLRDRCRKPVVTLRLPCNMAEVMDGANQSKTQESNVEMELRQPVAEGDMLPPLKETFVSIEDTK